VELAFFGSVAGKLMPKTYIYEFLKDKFNERYPKNPGKVVAADGRIRPRAFTSFRDLFKEIPSRSVPPDPPACYVVFDSLAARGDASVGKRYAAMLDLTGLMPVRWIPKGRESIILPGIPVLNPDGTITPSNDSLALLLSRIPEVDTAERTKWRQEVLKVFDK
jgi:hypothetical protein